MKHAILGTLCCACALFAQPVSAQQRLGGTTTRIRYDFADFRAAGFAPTPAAGQLDSDEWIATGGSDTPFVFGGVGADGSDYGRGTSAGGTSTGGIYAYDVDISPVIENYALGMQPTTEDFTPGLFQLRIINNTGAALNAIELSYTFLYRNDGARSMRHSVRVLRGDSNATSVSIASLQTETPGAASPASVWVPTPQSATVDLSSIPIPDGEFFTVVFQVIDFMGTGDRDEIAFDDVTIALPGCGNGEVEVPEACDDGNIVTEAECNYGTASCMACSADCTMPLTLTGPVCGDAMVDGAHGETCDDGNTTAGDGCDDACALESGTDAGMSGVDASTTIDAGAMTNDGGITDVDAGDLNIDAGDIQSDAGQANADASSDSDAGARADGGGAALAGSGCSCRAAGAPTGRSGTGALLGIVLLLGLPIMRRHQR
jgi:MYXO-CTERM domain-containing protein